MHVSIILCMHKSFLQGYLPCIWHAEFYCVSVGECTYLWAVYSCCRAPLPVEGAWELDKGPTATELEFGTYTLRRFPAMQAFDSGHHLLSPVAVCVLITFLLNSGVLQQLPRLYLLATLTLANLCSFISHIISCHPHPPTAQHNLLYHSWPTPEIVIEIDTYFHYNLSMTYKLAGLELSRHITSSHCYNIAY